MAHLPQIPRSLTDPVPVLTIGILGWIVALVVFTATGERTDDALATCWSGIAVGAVGFGIFLAQRAASRRGSKTAQRGLD
ncbi:hypothetical protein CH306_03740 [Rhodococcus sp. 15-725-2-2b]|uniref:DUF2530 domain-containing protein n=1 Tax=unclassified Rhodococcus (in: high G+C Gram-positive bacteria) TaxID=192944 RepID=UPI000B9B1DD6|nr:MULTISPECIES: DUF2530 domain-containing protein [unclassified Rhodococcus (in: high G+C Gram-positive bacteria)]OZC66956.1 hypothetical protein CH276_07040 [Rhodococcus sp. 06-470-2]OZC72755.1 hypothetical protein CH277_02015 [Rhodococcus sp. 06-469-3-2]OZD48982.1 hypothetical protein CH264_07240 [Rhodococcus sp. 06-1477-1A]OZE03098.1 hypothetical protein CH250_22995 [Rhodococcus sp. 05-2255-3C]OZE09488.1 hypothetical protein CH249_14930 [Rhodococcus sp. 05-2255-3B1]